MNKDKSKNKTELNNLYTRWGRNIDRTCPLPEYPMPQMKRDNWTCLNGVWDYAICSEGNDTMPEVFDGEILVPFSPESLLSGVGRQLKPYETLWYRRKISFADIKKGQRVILHFGAVDQCCKLYLNGKQVGSHSGGYWPFSFDITEHIKAEENEIILEVTDLSDAGDEAYGKQKQKRGGIWYTGQSGIWQTVWYEIVPEKYIIDIKITPSLKEDEITLEINRNNKNSEKVKIKIFEGDKLKYDQETENDAASINMNDYTMWTPDNPFLYTVEISAGEDKIESYFAMREFGMVYDEEGHLRISLNGEVLFQSGLLDQGYWSDGMYTPPSDEAMIWDISELKKMGFNMLRKHIKIEPMRWYYHCDRLGMIVWQDFVNGGNDYNPMVTMVLPFIGIKLNDKAHKSFGRKREEGKSAFERDMKRTIDLLYNTPCIAVWVPFNEGWGQFDSCRIAGEVKNLDGTRLIDHASGWHDQGCGDFCSKHIYYRKYRLKPDKHIRIHALTEFGGYSCPEDGHMSSGKLFGYRMYKTKKELTNAVVELYREEIMPAVTDGLSACIYTQVSDVEDEINGIFTYDREVTKLDVDEIKKVNADLVKPIG